jgi:transposase
MDNLSVHRSKKCKSHMEELGFKYVYNASYMPQFNPIEYSFSKFKKGFRAEKLNDIINKRERTTETLIKKALGSITKRDCLNYIQHS